MPNIKSAKKRVNVTNAKTLRNQMFKSAMKTSVKKYKAALADGNKELAAALLAGDGKDMFITLKESDVITKQTARLLGFAINRAFHGELSVEEMEELLA